ncbi:hypothetical protein LAC81_02035 [Ensifer adhaerens]|uniref:hypothetical protein n=1 Tax=Ensifer adhaerens TaxID=106592 RepID=UPI001CBB2307|nr:hypothetical protein [Ensifer adhaerens]MBZ7920566.1 hypothetical protein [Ensifer adhaerens]UAX93042.1 hypothetical protein LAC78_02030 [Ensifer adhaerens]UAY00678.1 hypothetical protein LAC80_02035 [Ensifer adhaerens]UAY08059.1 hypothetical protein LAC81_02035 [Ensifer adhaerens]
MTVWIRIALYMIAGWLYGSGYIGEEAKALITDDPAVAASIEAGIAAAIWSCPQKTGRAQV